VDLLDRRTFASDTRELRRMSVWWRDWATRAGLPGETVDDGELCLNEAVGNIIQHGAGLGVAVITITLERVTAGARMTIEDPRPPFNPLDYPEPPVIQSLADARVGGLGIPLIRAFTAEALYERDHDHNVLILTFSAERRS